jgi:hypothetical protein
LTRSIFFALVLSFSGVLAHTVFAQRSQSSTHSGEQRKAEKGLNDNRYFIYFLNSTISNYGTDEQKKIFREVIQRDIMSQFLYMKFMFYDSFVQIRKAQNQLITLYKESLKADTEQTKLQLDMFAPLVVNSKDALARHYLQLGYRETVNTRIEMGMADNYHETLYSMRLYKYVKAIKRIKEAKKYGFFAAIRAHQTQSEKIKQKPITFEDIDKNLSTLVDRIEIEKFKIMNIDSFYRFKDSKSLYDSVWENPSLETSGELRKYLNNPD